MKKLLLLSTLLCGSSLFGATVLENIGSFMRLAHQGKAAWENFEQKFMNAKCDLKKAQEADLFALHEKELSNLKASGCTDKLFQEKLADKIALCEKHAADMKALCDNYHTMGEQMHNEMMAKLDKFKQDAGIGSSTTGWGSLGTKGYGYGSQAGTLMEKLGEAWRTMTANMPTK